MQNSDGQHISTLSLYVLVEMEEESDDGLLELVLDDGLPVVDDMEEEYDDLPDLVSDDGLNQVYAINIDGLDQAAAAFPHGHTHEEVDAMASAMSIGRHGHNNFEFTERFPTGEQHDAFRIGRVARIRWRQDQCNRIMIQALRTRKTNAWEFLYPNEETLICGALDEILNGGLLYDLADLGDEYANAFKKLNILLWLKDSGPPGRVANGDIPDETGALWDYMNEFAMYDFTEEELEDLARAEGLIANFIYREWVRVCEFEVPVPSLEEYKARACERWRATFPPDWYGNVTTNVSDFIYGRAEFPNFRNDSD
jgi:hypothetical protein